MDVFPVVHGLGKFYRAVCQSKQCPVFAHTDIFAGVKLGTFLADDNVARDGSLTAE